MKYILSIVCAGMILFVGGCKNDPQEEVVSFEDIVGETGEIEADSSDVMMDTVKLVNPQLVGFTKAMLPQYDTTAHDEFHPMDRFNYSTVRKIQFIGKNEVPYGKTAMVIPKAKCYYYTFSDTLKTNNAFYNWLDCFGDECDELSIGTDMDAIKMPPMFTVVYDTTIVVLEYMCEHEKNDWNSFQDSLISRFGKNYKYMIDVDCGGPLKWK